MENVYIDKLNHIVNKYNFTYHRTIKIKTVDIKSRKYIDFGIKSNEKDPKLKVGDHVSISNHKNIFAKGNVPNWSEEVFLIIFWKVKNIVPWTFVSSDLNGEEIVGTLY